MSEIRTDPLFGTVSIVARERAARPQRARAPDILDLSRPCPLCLGNENLCPPEVARVEGGGPEKWQIRVFPNRYPALGLESEPVLTDLNVQQVPYSQTPGFGVHEVIVESPSHTLPFWTLEVEHSVRLFSVIQRRIRDLFSDRRILYLQLFKNHRAAAGGSLEHPHLQLVGLPFIPAPALKLISSSHCLVCALLEHELEKGGGNPALSAGLIDGSRTIRSPRYLTETSKWVALSDFAPSYPYQFSIYPKTHQVGMEESKEDELEELAQLCSLVLGRYERLLGDFALNLVVFTQPNPEGFARPQRLFPWASTMHWFLRAYPRIGQKAGLELSTGLSIVHVAPEDAARAFREKGV